MKHCLMGLSLICFGSIASASPLSYSWGLDSKSLGGVLSHDFSKSATIDGLEWDAIHLKYNSSEVGELGLFGGARDTDKRFMVGPSFGTSGMNVGKAAKFVHNFFDWPILTPLEDMGNYLNGYVNLGFNLAHLSETPFVGLGVVAKYGGN